MSAPPSSSSSPADLQEEKEAQEKVERAKELLNQLLEKTRQYLSRTGSPAKKAPNKSKHRMTEAEQDAELLSTEGDSNPTSDYLTVQPPNIKFGTMRKYQIEGLNWMIRLYNTGVSGILADEMGLGKTLQSISMLAFLKQFKGVNGKHIVVVPLSTLGNWVREFNRWCPELKTLKYHGTKEERADQTKLVAAGDWEVLLTSYEIAIKEKSTLKKWNWEYLVVDEAHRLKNENSLLSETLRSLSTKFRLLLTGTPLQNNLHELWALLNFMLPEIFTSAEDFDMIFNSEAAIKGDILQHLHTLLRPFMIRRMKKDVEHSLLPKKETLVLVPMSKLQKEVYVNVFNKNMDSILGQSKERSRLLNIVMQLRKAANHPYLFEGVEDRTLNAFGEHLITNSGKLRVLDKLLDKLKKKGSRVLLFSQMTRMIDILEDYARIRGYKYCRLDGSTAQEDREVMMKDYNAEKSEKFLFLLSTRAGGLGINLYTADVVVLFDSDWNPQMDLQAQDRAHRIGQKKQVFVYRLATEHTIEVKIIEKAQIKLRLDALVIQQGRLAQKKKMTKQDMQEMITFGADRVFKSEGEITDEDIDAILARGQKATEEMNNKLEEHVGGFANLTFDGAIPEEMFTIKSDGDKEDDKAVSKLRDLELVSAMQDSLGKRDRKQRQGYAVDDYYKTALANPKRTSKLNKPHREPKMSDHQFWNRKRIEALLTKEINFYHKHQYDADPPALRGLTDSENDELEALLSNPFEIWMRNDYHAYVRAATRYGREDAESISKAVPSKTPEEVKKYHAHLWEHIDELGDAGKRLLKTVLKGETKLEKANDLETVLNFAVAEHGSRRELMNCMPLNYKPTNKVKGYDEREDRFLLAEAQEAGLGNYERVLARIQEDDEWTFDYCFKSRTEQDLTKRVETLIRLRAKDYETANPGKFVSTLTSKAKSSRAKPKKEASDPDPKRQKTTA